MLRRLHQDQPESFAFTPANQAWAEGQIGKYPEGRQASAIIPLLWRAQEQEGWLSRAAIEHVAGMLGMAPIRALEVATFYFMFQLQPVGRVAHLQVCGTLSCMLCGAEDLVAVCREKIAREPHKLSADGKFSWEEVECLGACANAPMVQIGKDYYEDLDKRSFADLIDRLGAGEVPRPGSYKRRFASEPEGGATSLVGAAEHKANASVEIAAVVGDTVRRIDGTEPAYRVEIIDAVPGLPPPVEVEVTPFDRQPEANATALADDGEAPVLLAAAPEDGGDDLRKIKGVGPKLAAALQGLGIYTYDQIASWGPKESAWVNARLDIRGRIERDDWVGQAKLLRSGQKR
ncbi:MAG: NADH-quinone oxidoreductase subunit NuoE [Pseudomonadota bacterium]